MFYIINLLCPQSILEDVELIHEPAVGDSVVHLLSYPVPHIINNIVIVDN